MFSLYNWMLVSQWRCHTVTGRISRPAGHDWIKLLFRESHKIIYTVVNFPSFYGIWNNGLVIWPLTLVRSRGWSFVGDRAQARCPARRGGDGADVTWDGEIQLGHTTYTQQLWGFICGCGGLILDCRIYFCTHTFWSASQDLKLRLSRSPANNPRGEADPLWRWKPQFEYSGRCWPKLAWAGSRPDCGIGAAICHRCHLNACYGDEWIWIISSNITSSLFRTQTTSVPPCNHNDISRS